MGITNVTLKQLSQPAQALLKNRGADASLAPAEWAAVFREVSGFEQSNDSRRRTAGYVLAATIVGLIASVFPGFAVMPSVAIVLVGLFAIGVVVAGVRYRRIKQLDLGPDFRELLAPLFGILQDDLEPGKPVQLRLDLRGATNDKIARHGKVDPGKDSRVKSLTQTVYRDPWCKLRAQMAGGHRLQLTMATTTFKNSRYYRARSGKNKTKVKWKKVATVAAALTPSQDRLAVDHSHLRSLGSHGKCAVEHRKRGETLRVTRKFKAKTGDRLERTVAPGQVLDILFALCRALAPAGSSKHGN